MTHAPLFARLAVLVVLLLAGSSAAQVKVGVVDLRRVLTESSAGRRRLANLEEALQNQRLDLEKRQAEFEALTESVDPKDSQSVRRLVSFQGELVAASARLERDRRDATRRLEESIAKDVREVLGTVAVVAKVDLVLDASIAAFRAPRVDLTTQTIAELDNRKK